ncbi:hypothetical protein OSTOST_05457, partial [Ostertagia ostertagi]
LDNSFVFFIGDHGPRFGRETRTSFGRHEANNPFLYMTVPKWLRNSEMFKVLKAKEYELITPHDIHATLKDILEIPIRSKNGVLKAAGSTFTRLNEYGKQSACITKDFLKPLCHCTKHVYQTES